MLRLAICDDDMQELSRISSLLHRYRAEKDVVFKYDSFFSAIELLDAMKRLEYHILLLDVFMPGISGIQAAREIRSFDDSIKIIFLTSSSEFAVESYAVNAHYYLLKPGKEEVLFPILDRIFQDAQRGEEALHIQSPSGYMRLPYSRIEFLEVLSKKLLFHLSDGSVKEFSGSLAEYEGRFLSRHEFVKVHRSYIVNMEYIRQLQQKMLVTCAGQAVPVSRLLYAGVRESYMQHLFLEKGVE